MTQLIRSIDGDTLEITEDRLTEITKLDGDAKYYVYLKGLNKYTRSITLYQVEARYARYTCHGISMDWDKRQIGCQTFSRDTFRIIARAIKAAALKG